MPQLGWEVCVCGFEFFLLNELSFWLHSCRSLGLNKWRKAELFCWRVTKTWHLRICPLMWNLWTRCCNNLLPPNIHWCHVCLSAFFLSSLVTFYFLCLISFVIYTFTQVLSNISVSFHTILVVSTYFVFHQHTVYQDHYCCHEKGIRVFFKCLTVDTRFYDLDCYC